MNLLISDIRFSVVKLPPETAVPAWAMQGEFWSVTGTPEETSVVCPSAQVPPEFSAVTERGWRCMKVDGTLDFSLTGILSSLARPLAEHHISIFAISTYNTDYLLVKDVTLENAVAVLEAAGHHFI